MLSQSEVRLYLKRIGMDEAAAGCELPSADAELLSEIQWQHILHVPFENLDVEWGALPLSLDEHDLFEKVVCNRRGGICYEQNLLAGAVLEALGYSVRRMSGQHPKYGNDFDHCFLFVDAPNAPETTWLFDVGFSENFNRPLKFEVCEVSATGEVPEQAWQNDGFDDYCIVKAPGSDGYYYPLRRRNGKVQRLYAFSLTERTTADYRPRCDWYCTAPQSRFTQGALVSITREDGRLTLSSNHLIRTLAGEREVRNVNNKAEFNKLLKTHFGIDPQ